MTPDAKEKLQLSLAASAFTLVVTIAGAYTMQSLSQRNSEHLFRLQRERDLRERSYAKLAGLKVPWSQAIQTRSEAVMLAEFYYVRFQRLSHDKDDLAEAKRQNERALTLIAEISKLQREAFEALAEARISYSPTPQLTAALDALYRFKSVEVYDVDRSTIKEEADLLRWKDRVGKRIVELAKSEYQDKIDALLPLLEAQLRE